MKKLYLFLILFSVINIIYGQNQYPDQWQARGIGGGGALFSPSINPGNENEYFVACDMSDIFHTTDYGLTYSQLNFQQIMGSDFSKVIFTKTQGLLYCINYTENNALPVKSTDNGLTWIALSGNPYMSDDVYSVNADYNNPNRVIISFYGYIYFSNDGGNTFNLIHTELNNNYGCIVGGVFFDTDTIYIGSNDGLLVSKNGGTSFISETTTGIQSTEGIFTFAGARTGNNIRFFCLTGLQSNMYVGQTGADNWGFLQGVYTMDNNSGTWTSKMTGITKATDYLMFVGMAENDINTCYLAGSVSNSVPNIMKTTDGGNSWTHTFNTANNQNIITGWSGTGGDKNFTWGQYAYGISVAAGNSNYAIYTDLGFVHKTTDGGQTWQQAYVDITDEHPAGSTTPTGKYYYSIGLENTSCWQVLWLDENNMFACYSDIMGIRSTDGGASWSFNYTGRTANTIYRMVQAPATGNLFAATSNVHDMYQSTRLKDAQLDANDGQGKIIYSTDNGATWSDMHVFNHPVFWLALDPNNATRMYASVIDYGSGTGVGGIYVCNDINDLASSLWTKLSNPTRTQGHPASIVVLNNGKVVCTYSGRIDAATGKFTNSSGVFVYDPGNSTWSDVSDAGMYYWTKDIVIDPNDASQKKWYAGVFSGWGGAPNGLGGLYKTTNSGQNWTRINTLDRVTSITFNPSDSNQIYLTTEYQGLWTSLNINAANPQFTLVDSYPFKQPERVFFNPYNANEVWVSSFGSGMKEGNPSANQVNSPDTPDNIDIQVYPNPGNGYFNIRMKGNTGKINAIKLYNTSGQEVYSNENIQAINNLRFNNLDDGVYYLLITTGNSVFKKKIVIIN